MIKKKKQKHKPEGKTKAHLEGETLKRFVANGTLYYFLHDFVGKKRKSVRQYVWVYLDPETNAYGAVKVTAHRMLGWLKREGLSASEAQAIKYEICGKFGK